MSPWRWRSTTDPALLSRNFDRPDWHQAAAKWAVRVCTMSGTRLDGKVLDPGKSPYPSQESKTIEAIWSLRRSKHGTYQRL